MVPKLRFSKFSKEWTKIRLGDYLQNYQKKVSSDTDIPVYSSSRQGLKPQAEYFADRELQNDGEYGVVPFGYITYRHMSDDNTFHFNLNNKLPEIAVSKEYPVFTGKGLNNYFLLSKLNHTDEFKLFAIQQKAGGTRTRLYFKNLCEWRATFPELEEQIQISDFLSSVDERIKLLNKQYDLLCQYKKGMMQKIFSQEVRFKDENGEEFPEWQIMTLGEIAQIKRGASPRPITDPIWFDSSSNIGWVRISDVTKSSKYLLRTEQYVSDKGVKKSRLVNSEKIIMSICATIGKPICTTFDVCIHDGFVVFESLSTDKDFLYYYLSFIEDNWQRYGQPGTQINLNVDIVSNESINIPSLSEQIKISQLLANIDNKLTLKKAELDKLKTWKQGLLQQMFV